MLDFQQKKKARRIFYSKPALFCLFILAVLLGRSTWVVFQREQASSIDYQATARNYADLEARKLSLEGQIKSLNTNEGMEKEIRDRFSVAKPGETVVTVVDNSASSSDNSGEQKGFWGKVFGWIGL